jgi:hypothetical protein
MIAPEIGQIVRVADHEDRLIIKSLSEDEQRVGLVTMSDHPRTFGEVSVAELLPGEDLSAG